MAFQPPTNPNPVFLRPKTAFTPTPLCPLQHAHPARRPSKPTALKATATSNWQETIFGPDPANAPHLPNLQNSYPTTQVTLHALALSATSKTLYTTLQTAPTTPTTPPTTPPTLLSLPLPLETPDLARDLFTLLYGTQSTPQPALSPMSTRFAQTLLPTTLTRHFALPHTALSAAAASLLRSAPTPLRLNRVDATHSLLVHLGLHPIAAAVHEAPTVSSPGQISLTATLYIRRQTTTLYGDPVYANDLDCVPVTPAFAVILCNAVKAPVYIPHDIFDLAGVPLSHFETIFHARGAILVNDSDEQPDVADRCDLPGRPGPKIWELRAADVLTMTEGELRAQLRRCGVPTVRRDCRESLLGRMVGLMDEVQRREVCIALAAERGRFGAAAELQEGRSRRGRLLEELREAEGRAAWGEVVRIGRELHCVQDGIADVTAEPGSYDPYLDRDEWYRPNR